MHTLKENTTLVAFSEFRTHPKAVLKALGHSRVVISKRNQPIAVLIPIERYEEMEEMLDLVEDKVLGQLAHEREQKKKKKAFISLEAAEKKVGL